ncbi:DUF2339 domain-containing protein [Rhizobium sp. CC-YZS058]|uniref:DUF2339 domain-containing protein n=1 Tax=Rhizobium sp. CC-YZS058 TaxID=3042153 RepID=UPI002B05890A|nr:DUF2339 domain-containing protein [Rhizobium sp. CC-YZS058]MEA3535434.1 DUF2339 domain-containing protein [Rhizobium sp. CC-YZS058]
MIELLVLAAFILSLNAFVRARRATERVERELLALKEEVAALRAAGGVGGAPRVLVPEGQGAAATAVPADPQDQGETTPEALPGSEAGRAAATSIEAPSAVLAAVSPQADRDGGVGEAASISPELQAASTAPKGALSLESLMGGRWAVWVGGVALALGGVFLVKVSIDAGLLGPGPRLILASLFGLMLFGAGEIVRRRSASATLPGETAADPAGRSVSQGADDALSRADASASRRWRAMTPVATSGLIPGVLTAAGAVTLLGAAYAAHGIYGFIGPGLAFVAMAAVSFATLALSLLHGQALAGLGLAASLLTPALISTEDPSVETLFGFLTLAWLASLVAARLGRWRIVPVLGNLGLGLWALATLVTADVVAPTPLTLAFLVVVAGLGFIWPAGADEVGRPAEPAAEPAVDAAREAPVPGSGFSRLFMGGDRSARPPRQPGPWRRLLLPRHGWVVLSGALVVLMVALGYLTPDLLAERDPTLDAVLLIATLAGLSAWRSGAAWAGGLAGFGAVAATLVAASTPALNLPVDLTIAPGGPLEPSGEAARPIAFGLSAIFLLLCGLVVRRRRLQPGAALTYWSALTALVTLASPSITFLMIGLFGLDLVHGGAALAMAAALLGLAALAGPAAGAAQVWLLAGALAQLVLAAHALTEGLVTALVISAVAALFALAGRRLAWPGLPWMTALGLLAILGRIAIEPTVVGQSALGRTPILNALLPGYGVPALVALGAAWAYRHSADRRLRNVLQGLASLLALLTLAILARHAMNGGQLSGGPPSLGEQSIYTLLLIGASGIMMRLDLSQPSSVLRLGSLGLGIASLLSVLSAHLIGLNPYWSGEPLGRFPVVDLLLIGYLLPALAYAGLARFAQGRRPRAFIVALGIGSGLLGFAWATLSVRRAWQGQGIADWKGFLPGETYTYSVVWLLLGVALLALSSRFRSAGLRIASAVLVVLTVLKVFLIDMSNLEGLLRALSFIGLGAVLIGIGLVYQKILTGSKSPAENA